MTFDPEDFERIEVRRGERSGAMMAVAVQSTRLGPALGGARLWHYASPDEALADVRRLAAAMTLKAAAAGLDLGGGKGVLIAPAGPAPEGELRRAMLLDFGDLVESLHGAYVTAEDVGTGAADMAAIAERTDHVVGLDPDRGGSGDPSPVTALGVVAAMRACAKRRFGARDLAGLRVCVIGLGHVGTRVAELLRAEGAEVSATDVDERRRNPLERLGGTWIAPERAILTRCDVLAPCALGGAIGPREARLLPAAIVCGAANNVLTGPRGGRCHPPARGPRAGGGSVLPVVADTATLASGAWSSSVLSPASSGIEAGRPAARGAQRPTSAPGSARQIGRRQADIAPSATVYAR